MSITGRRSDGPQHVAAAASTLQRHSDAITASCHRDVRRDAPGRGPPIGTGQRSLQLSVLGSSREIRVGPEGLAGRWRNLRCHDRQAAFKLINDLGLRNTALQLDDHRDETP